MSCKSCKFWQDPNRGHESFNLLMYSWNIDEAKKILAARPRESVEVPLASVRGLIDYPPKPDGASIMSVWVDTDHVSHVDTTIPGIMGYLPISVPLVGKTNDASNRHRWPIDGYHRIARAIDLGLTTVPMLMLTAEESDWICRELGQRVSEKNPLEPLLKDDVRPVEWACISPKEQASQLCRYCDGRAEHMRHQGRQGWVPMCLKHAAKK
jgi:hypothetical protein